MIGNNDVINLKDLVVYFNVLIGVIAVLAVLILILLITYFANIKPNLSKSALHNNSVDNAIAQIVNNEEVVQNNNELVAVITAAIK